MIPHRFRKRVPFLAVAGLAVLLFFGYAYLVLAVPGIDASPDESANRMFSRAFSITHRLYVYDQLNQVFDVGPIHPRSTLLVDDLTLPAGFIGLPFLYGAIGMVAGIGVQPFLTPLLAVLGVLAWGGAVAAAYGRRVGTVAAALLATHAAWWYWSARTFMPNVPFFAFLAIGAWFALASPVRRAVPRFRLGGFIDCALAGTAFGLALGIRLSEGMWMGVALIVALAVARRFPWKRLLCIALFTAMTLAPLFALNDVLYGEPFFAGYAGASNAVATAAPQGGMGAKLLGPVGPLLFPLGFAPRTAFAHFRSFGVGLFPQWWAIVAAAVLILAIFAVADRRKGALERAVTEGPDRELRRGFLWGGLVAAGWLVLLYGSWTVHDNPDPSAVTIGASYVRYWIPVFALSTVPVAAAVVRMRSSSFVHRVLGAAILTFALVIGPYVAFSAPQEGLDAVRRVLVEDRAVRNDIVARTEDDAVIIVDRADKFLYPWRRVIRPLRDERTYAAIATLEHHAPLYYFGITLPQRDLDWLNQEKLPPLGASIRPVMTYDERTLYALPRLADSTKSE